jgi:TonB family protein
VQTKSFAFINGLLGTIILHLVIGIIFFAAKLSGMYKQEVQVKVETPESIRQELLEEKQKLLDKISQQQNLDKRVDAFIAAQNRRNIGVNMSGKDPAASEKDLQDIQKDIDAAKTQISGIQENLDKQSERDKITESRTDEGANVAKKNIKIQGKLAVYKGPTNIYYDLVNRRDINLYVPVYKCQGHGRVVVNIIVNQEGDVENATVDKNNSDNDDCLFEAAQDAAERSKFNSDLKNAPARQKGTITYLFVAQ